MKATKIFNEISQQGDRIGRIFDYWANVDLGQFFIITEVDRVTRLGEFSHFGRLFTLGCFLIINFGALFPKKCRINLVKKVLGYILGDF
jgi:hypothetical protein